MPPMFTQLRIILQQEIISLYRQPQTWLTPLLFFAIVICLFPLALGPNGALLSSMAPAIIWVAALLAVIMSMPSVFGDDAKLGYIDLLILSPVPLTLLVFCKVLGHWLTHCLPLILLSPLLGVLLQLTAATQWTLIMTLLLGTPVLSLLGAIGAALTVGVNQSGLLLPILIMPLYIPVLIFGTASVSVSASAAHDSAALTAYLAILAALTCITLAFAPWLTAKALKVGMDQ